ncbi:hypothetical protein AWI85_14405 [Listeria monocytogenes]|uniref:hypothetical protein n=1 Tax=Listeria monocytogenes TaxID=1639 RepID=UPI00077586E2|nr:hypothetical protein AWI86_13995 [Listeria monocytogenes]KXS78402.1 hypothetical protein AWI85_14405 [Listeria monocytogenes]KXX11266.1 hypothetical protein AWI84_14615 [Listeria monocytogenes]KXX17186.1 hypothetical protein AWI83_14455 [Listeria monocytogenes]KXX18335.1 hypothetical protein AWI82_14455 [Listeria monocytogenes]
MELIIVKLTKNIYLFLSHAETLSYHLYKNGVGLYLIQVLLNHSSPKTTLRYIGIEQEDKDQAVSSLGL